MRKRFLALLILLFVRLEIPAAAQTGFPEFEAARDKYQQTLQAIWTDRNTQLTPVLKVYGDRLQQLRKKFADAADPKGVEAVEDEQQRLLKGLEPTDDERRAMPGLLRITRTSFEKERTNATQKSVAAETQASAAWTETLTKWYRRLTGPFETDPKSPGRAAIVRAELERVAAARRAPASLPLPPPIAPVAPAANVAAGEDSSGVTAPTPARREALTVVRRIKLANPDKAREAEDVLAGAASVDAALLKDVASMELFAVHDVSEAPMRHNGGEIKRVAGGWAKEAVVGNNSGIFIWGPYESLEPGRYVVVYRLRFMEPAGEKNLCFVDVAHGGVTVHGIRPDAAMAPPKQWVELGVSLNLPKKVDLEYRLWGNKHGIAIDRIYVFHITAP
jgi:hypothetical protein